MASYVYGIIWPSSWCECFIPSFRWGDNHHGCRLQWCDLGGTTIILHHHRLTHGWLTLHRSHLHWLLHARLHLHRLLHHHRLLLHARLHHWLLHTRLHWCHSWLSHHHWVPVGIHHWLLHHWLLDGISVLISHHWHSCDWLLSHLTFFLIHFNDWLTFMLVLYYSNYYRFAINYFLF